MEKKNKPIKQLREGRVLASIWKNRGKNGAFYKVTFEALYKPEGSDGWKSSRSFSASDVGVIRDLTTRVELWIQADSETAPRTEA